MASLLDTLTYVSVILLVTVRISGFISLLSLGLGVGLASWLFWRLVGRSRKKSLEEDSYSGSTSVCNAVSRTPSQCELLAISTSPGCKVANIDSDTSLIGLSLLSAHW